MLCDDIMTRLRDIACLRGPMSGSVIPVACTEAADEIERLRAERLQWFIVAHELRAALLDEVGKGYALDEYLRTRGRLEDPRGN